MKMLRFRIQNYKKIEDTDWIHTDDITVFVGKNESGKSTIFRGLSKLNPSDDSKYDGLKEFPRRRYSGEFKDENWPVSSVEFELDSDEQSELTEISPSFSKVSSVIVTRYYNNKYSISYDPVVSSFRKSTRDYVSMLEDWKGMMTKARAPEGKGEVLQPVRDKIISIIDSEISSIGSPNDYIQTTEEQISTLFSNINSQISEDWMETIFKNVVDAISSLHDKYKINSEISAVFDWVVANIPEFIYFDRYDVLDSAIHIDDFIRHLSEDPGEPKLRITKCLFEHVGLDVEKIRALDPNNEQKTKEELERMADERAIEMSSASQEMTQKFTSWWEQRKHKFRYHIDGKNFRVWVSDDLDPSEIELDQRSAGMQYFFSFYLVFLVEASGEHANSILLLDEPGMQFHGTAQQKTVEFLNKISKDNQLLYTTHSPFMIDGDHLENVKIVYEDESNYGVTKVSNDVWPKDKDSLFPLQVGLGYSLAQTMFYSKYQLIVEGLTDYVLLKAMNELLGHKSLTTLNEKIIITPAGGTRNIMPLAGMLIGEDVKIISLLDGDQPGLQKQKDLKEKLLVDSVIIDTFTGKSNSEIEDMFEDNFYLNAAKTVYPKQTFDFNDVEKDIQPVITRIEKLFERKSYGKFEKWKVNQILVNWIQTQQTDHEISDVVCAKFASLMKKINSKLG